jgi:hypothetical protein
VVGNGAGHTIEQLIVRRSEERAAATDGESRIPLDDQCLAVVARAGYTLGDVLSDGETLVVRHAANLHAGGTLEDVTKRACTSSWHASASKPAGRCGSPSSRST